MATNNPVSQRDMLDIIFSNRNKTYGAYAIRRAYNDNLTKAFLIGISLIAAAVFAPIILRAMANNDPKISATETTIELKEAIDIEKPPVVEVPKPPQEVKPPQPQQSFKPPVIMEDDKAVEKEQHAVEELVDNDKNIGATDIDEGEKGPPILDIPDDLDPVVETQAHDDDSIREFGDVQKMPGFPGGEYEMRAFLKKNIKYPQMAVETGVEGTVALSFVVGKNGEIMDIQVLKDPGAGLGKEAVRVIKSMPKWVPGEANGNPVKVRFTMPVIFRLN